VINGPSAFGHFMIHSRVYHRKIIRRICRIWKDVGRGELMLKKAQYICFLTNTSVVMDH
jgi:hypothetical protein